MSAEIIDINERARDAWDAYVFAKEKAQWSGAFEDGIAAGRAWRTFLNLFVLPELKMDVAPPRVVSFEQRKGG